MSERLPEPEHLDEVRCGITSTAILWVGVCLFVFGAVVAWAVLG